MKAFCLALATGAALAFGHRVAVAQDPHARHTDRQIMGRVVDRSSGQPVAGASVAVTDRIGITSTDLHGHFVIRELPAARVRLTTQAIGYAPITVPIDLTDTDQQVVVSITPLAVTLDSIVVKGNSRAEAELRDRQSTARLNAEELARQRGQTLGETLKEVPGVTVIQYGPSIAKPVIRGLHSQRIVVMNGGVPQEGQQWGAEHAPEIDAFAANDIEVIRGAAGVLYGSNAIGGVVRVLPRPLPTTGRLGGQFETNGFSNNRQGAASLLLEGAGLDLPLVGPIGWRIQGTYRRAGDGRTPNYYLPNTGFEELDWSGAFGVHRSWGSSELGYSHFGTTLGMYSGAHVGNLDDLARAMANPIVSQNFSYAINRPDQEVKHDLVSWRNRFAVSEAAQLDVDYGYQYNDRNEFDSHGFAAATPRPAFGLRLITHTLEARLHHAPTGHLAGTFGVSGMRQGNLSPGRSFLIPQYRLYSGGIYGLEQWTRSRLTISAGLRYDYRWQHAFQYGAPVVISPDDVSSDRGVSGTLGATFKLAETWSVAATVGRMWRAPNVNERFSQGVHHGTAQYEIGDPALGKERTRSIDASLRHVGSHARFELSGYDNRVDDFIFLEPREPIATVRGAYPAYQYTATNARLRGLEVSFQADPAGWLSFYTSGTLVRGIDRTTGTPLYDMPADRLIASLRFYGPKGRQIVDPYFEIGTTLVRRQDQVPPVTVYRLPTDGYALMNAEIGARELRVFGQRTELGLSVRNLFDVRYRDYLSRYRLYVDDTGRDLVLRFRTGFGHTTS